MKNLLLLALLACSSTPASQAQRHSDAAVGSKITALENLWNQAAQANDANAVDNILDDTFVHVTSEGRLLTKAEVLAEVKAPSNRFVITSESMIVRLHGDTAIVTGIRKTTGLERGRPFARQDRFVDTWLYRDGSWVSIASLATPIA
jgi:ketosteroid isomerase-like protein